jgi:iron complex outermembrane recepter protein
MPSNLLVVAVRLALVAGAMSASIAQAQEGASLDEITVTGSRIRQETGMTTPVPVTAVTTQELASFDPGATIADQLDSLPQLFQTESAQRSSGALFGNAGGSYVNLRGLGTNRTLVLLDGSRMVPADRVGAVNVGTFPTALVKSVDIVTGGASAQYGADAVGGVVNFVLDRNFEGMKIGASTGITEEGDGFNTAFSVAAGSRIGDRMHVIGSLEMRNIDEIERDPEELGSWFQRVGWVTNPAWRSTDPPGTNPQRLTLPNVVSATHSPTGLITAGYTALSPTTGLGTTTLPTFSLLRNTFTNNGQGVRPFVNGGVTAITGTQVRERSAFIGMKYDLSERTSLIGQVLYGNSESNQPNQRGLPHLQDIWFATIYRDNAFLPTSVRNAMVAQNVQALQVNKLGQWLGEENWNDAEDPRNQHELFTWSVGFEADVFKDWQFRVNWQQGKTDKFTAVYDELRVDRMFLALDAVIDTRVGSPTQGQAICNVQLYNPTPSQLAAAVVPRTSKLGGPLLSPVGLDDTISGCVPLNAFGQGQVSQAAQDYLVGDKIGTSWVKQSFAEMLMTGTLVEAWAGPIGAAFGATYRDQSFSQSAYSGGTPGPTEVEALGPPLNAPTLGIRGIPGGFTGGSANLHQFSTVPPISGDYDVYEAFVEVNMPLWKSDSGQRLDVDGAFRYSDYSSSGSVEAYKFGVDFQLFNDLRLRATYSRDVREATFSERFDQQGGGGTVNDPQFGNASGQITTVRGGNPNLLPEEGDTYTAGLIYRPSWIQGLQASVDWYDITINDAVGQLGQQRIVDECYAGTTALCSLVERDPTSNRIVRVFDVFLNVAEAKVRGVDFEIQYSGLPDWIGSAEETFTVRALAGHTLERSNLATPTSVRRVLDGGFDTGVLYPEWKADLVVRYTIGPWGTQLSQEYISSSKINGQWVEGRDVDDNTLPAYANTNMRLSYEGETGAGSKWDVSLFVTNLFDRHPIIVPNYDSRVGAQNVSNNYDAYGRRYQLGVNYRF